VPLNDDGCKDRYAVLAHLHLGNTFQFGHSEQKVFNENVTAEWLAFLVRKVFCAATIIDKAIDVGGLSNNDSRLCISFVISSLFR